MDAHFYESPSDKTKKKKGAGKEQNLHLFNGGALLMQADEGESSINFFMRVLRTFADWKYELSKDEIEIRLLTAGVETLQLKEVLPNISQYVNKWTSIYNEEVTRIIKLLLTWVKPSVGTHSYSLYFSMAVESLAYKNKTNKIITTFDAFYNSYTRQESEEEYDKFFSCFKFGMDDKNERAYFELLKIYFAGIVYNMFAPELRLALKDNKYRPKHIHEDKWEEILKEVNNEFPMFSGMIIICGEQGLGKSYLINSILPDTLRDGLRIGSDLIPSTDEIKFSIAKKIRGCFIMNLEDISMPYIKRLPTFIKNQLDRIEWSYRFLFSNNMLTVRRRWTPIATTNHNKILLDPTGNRRILPLYIREKNRKVIDTIDRNKLWNYFYHLFIEAPHKLLNFHDTYGKELTAVSSYHLHSRLGTFYYNINVAFKSYEPTADEKVVEVCRYILSKADDVAETYAFFALRWNKFLPLSMWNIKIMLSDENTDIEEPTILKYLNKNNYLTFKGKYIAQDSGIGQSQAYVVLRHSLGLLKRINGMLQSYKQYGNQFSLWNTFKDNYSFNTRAEQWLQEMENKKEIDIQNYLPDPKYIEQMTNEEDKTPF